MSQVNKKAILAKAYRLQRILDDRFDTSLLPSLEVLIRDASESDEPEDWRELEHFVSQHLPPYVFPPRDE